MSKRKNGAAIVSLYSSSHQLAKYHVLVDCVKWFRDCTERDHLREEVQICHAEFDCTVVSHQRMSEVWTQLGLEAACPGAGAYARKKAGMYADLRDTCKSIYASTKDALKDNGIGLDWIGWDGMGWDGISRV